MVNVLVWLILGGVVGWLASLVMRTDARQGILLNIVIGIAGAMIGGWVLSPILGVAPLGQDNFSVPGLVVALLGAVVLLGVINLIRRGSLR
jgi:uncharacterized membrane protein YeaQ/YmgE (transglycosylase-associated protein family)